MSKKDPVGAVRKVCENEARNNFLPKTRSAVFGALSKQTSRCTVGGKDSRSLLEVTLPKDEGHSRGRSE